MSYPIGIVWAAPSGLPINTTPHVQVASMTQMQNVAVELEHISKFTVPATAPTRPATAATSPVHHACLNSTSDQFGEVLFIAFHFFKPKFILILKA